MYTYEIYICVFSIRFYPIYFLIFEQDFISNLKIFITTNSDFTHDKKSKLLFSFSIASL